MANQPDTRTVNMVHHPNKNADDAQALDEFLDNPFAAGTLNVGVDDSVGGSLYLFNGSGSDSAEIYLYVDATLQAGAVDYYRMYVGTGDASLRLQREGAIAPDFSVNETGGVGLGQDSGIVSVGLNDSQAADVRLFGGATFGGDLKFYQGGSEDTGNAGEYFHISADGGEFLFRDESNNQGLVFNEDLVPRFPQVTNGMAALGNSGALTSWTGVPTNVAGSRTGSTSYQNTSGAPMFVTVAFNPVAGRAIQVSSDDFSASIINVGYVGSAGVNTCSFWVPDDWYYRVNGAVAGLQAWTETTI